MHAALIRLWVLWLMFASPANSTQHIAVCLQGMRLLTLQHSPAQLRSRQRGMMTCRGECWSHMPHVGMLHT